MFYWRCRIGCEVNIAGCFMLSRGDGGDVAGYFMLSQGAMANRWSMGNCSKAFFFSCVSMKAGPAAKMPWAYLFCENDYGYRRRWRVKER